MLIKLSIGVRIQPDGSATIISAMEKFFNPLCISVHIRLKNLNYDL